MCICVCALELRAYPVFQPSSCAVGFKHFEDLTCITCRRLEAKKNQNKKPKSEENEDFPRREQITFGEVVQAPPKLTAFPKVIFLILNII